MEQPVLTTARLVLRPFCLGDAREVMRLAGDRAIASTTHNIPHPYEPGMAEQWIATHGPRFDAGEGVSYAVTLRDGDVLLGAVGLVIAAEANRAELGYWIGKPYWGNGYCTEAARALLGYAFGKLGLHRVHARHLARNPASGRVMAKIGMRHEGHLRQHAIKWGVYEDVDVYGILRDEYSADGD